MMFFDPWWLKSESVYGAVLLILVVLLVAAFIHFLSRRN